MKNKLIYIGGSIKSGTTLFSAVLGNSISTINIGEFVAFDNKYEKNEMVFYNNEVVRIRNVELWNKLKHINTTENVKLFTYYKFVSEAFKNKIIIDSSKSQWNWTLNRFNEIKKTGLFDTYFIHLIRKPEAVVYSQTLKKNNQSGFSMIFKEYLKWIFTNFFTTIKYKSKRNYVKIRYEDFCKDPIQIIHLIEKFTGIEFETLKEKLLRKDVLYYGHSLDGNPLSFKEKQINEIRPSNSYKKCKSLNFILISLFFKPITRLIYIL